MRDAMITRDELEWAFKEFERRRLYDVHFTSDFGLVATMGRYTREDPESSAGCETGIKLGLLIAERRQRDLQAR